LPVFFSSQRSLGHAAIDGLPFPVNALEFVIFFQSHPPQFAEKVATNEGLKIAVQTAARAKGFGDGFPLATGAENKEDAVQDESPGQGRTPPFSVFAAFGQQRFKALPQGVRNTPIVVHDV
jgi:hypothetical protein